MTVLRKSPAYLLILQAFTQANIQKSTAQTREAQEHFARGVSQSWEALNARLQQAAT